MDISKCHDRKEPPVMKNQKLNSNEVTDSE